MKRIATIGFFDGVHKGHCFLFNQLRRIAGSRGLQPLIVTFDVHPRSILQSDYTPQLLTSLKEREELLRAYGEVLILPFAEVRSLTAREFMVRLQSEYDVEVLLMGYDHMFGSDRLRHPQEYQRIGEELGVEVLTMSEYVEGEWHVSSTEIRQDLLNGNIIVANELLGRPYQLTGTVVKGKGIGHTIGFPTANIQPDCDQKIIPSNGVYRVLVQLEPNRWTMGICNIGSNPTVGNTHRTIEVHIPDFQGDLYSKQLVLLFEQFIRHEKRFESIEALREQIKADIDSIRHQE